MLPTCEEREFNSRVMLVIRIKFAVVSSVSWRINTTLSQSNENAGVLSDELLNKKRASLFFSCLVRNNFLAFPWGEYWDKSSCRCILPENYGYGTPVSKIITCSKSLLDALFIRTSLWILFVCIVTCKNGKIVTVVVYPPCSAQLAGLSLHSRVKTSALGWRPLQTVLGCEICR